MTKIYAGNVKLAKGHIERARELAPELFHEPKPKAAPMAMDAAETTINEMVRKAMRAGAGLTTAKRSTSSRKETLMRRSFHAFDSNALFQRDPLDNERADGKAFAATVEALKRPGAALRGTSRVASRTATRRHAFDEGGPKMSELRELHGNLRAACDSLGELFQEKKFAFSKAREHAADAIEHADNIRQLLGGGGEDEATEAERDQDAATTIPTAAAKARDGSPDHRDDFNSIKQGAADSALTDFDAETLFQRE